MILIAAAYFLRNLNGKKINSNTLRETHNRGNTFLDEEHVCL